MTKLQASIVCILVAGVATPLVVHHLTNNFAHGWRPVSKLTNVGTATPSSTFETWNWAKANRNVKTITSTLLLDEDAKVSADGLLASLPEAKRAQFKSAQELVSALQVISTPIKGIRVISEDPLGRDDVVMQTQWQFNDGRIRTNSWQYHRADDGWRQVIHASLVDKLGAMVYNRDFGN
jgi:hypothetical protein